MTETRACSVCKKEKPVTSEFFHKGNHNDGFSYKCKVCVSVYRKKYYITHKEIENERNKGWYMENRHQKIVMSTKWNNENPDKVKGYRDNKWLEDPQSMIDRYEILNTYSPHEPHRHFLIKENVII